MKALLFTMTMLLPAAPSAAACGWPAWEQFKQNLITQDGRVIDPSTTQEMTTSEGQSYAMLFALVNNDPAMFRSLLRWTENNLARGDLTARLPAWSWGRDEHGHFRVLDANSASDADLWLAYTLLEAGRLWNEHGYGSLGTLLAQRISREEVSKLPGFGAMLLPGKKGFVHKDTWRLNPSYLPLQVLTRLQETGRIWKTVRRNALKLLMETAPKGYAADWVTWQKGQGWRPDAKQGNAGDYDAIRVYLWIGMLSRDSTEKKELSTHFMPMAELTARLRMPPESIDALTGKAQGTGPPGFSAALLPFLAGMPAAQVQRNRLHRDPPGTADYYGQVLALFGQGWDQQHFRFDKDGHLVPDWKACAN